MNDEPEIGTAISRWIAHLVMPLNQTRSIRNATFLLGRHRRREEEDFCADLLRFEFSALDQTALLPEVRGFRHGQGHRQLRVISGQLRNMIIAERVGFPSMLAIPGLQQRDHVFWQVMPPTRRDSLDLKKFLK